MDVEAREVKSRDEAMKTMTRNEEFEEQPNKVTKLPDKIRQEMTSVCSSDTWDHGWELQGSLREPPTTSNTFASCDLTI